MESPAEEHKKTLGEENGRWVAAVRKRSPKRMEKKTAFDVERMDF